MRLSPPCCAGQMCIGRTGTYSNPGTTFMDGADDVTQIDVPNVAAAMETCCSLCSNREDEEIGNCQAWDTFPAGDNAWLCQVGRSGWGQTRRWGEAPGAGRLSREALAGPGDSQALLAPRQPTNMNGPCAQRSFCSIGFGCCIQCASLVAAGPPSWRLLVALGPFAPGALGQLPGRGCTACCKAAAPPWLRAPTGSLCKTPHRPSRLQLCVLCQTYVARTSPACSLPLQLYITYNPNILAPGCDPLSAFGLLDDSTVSALTQTECFNPPPPPQPPRPRPKAPLLNLDTPPEAPGPKAPPPPKRKLRPPAFNGTPPPRGPGVKTSPPPPGGTGPPRPNKPPPHDGGGGGGKRPPAPKDSGPGPGPDGAARPPPRNGGDWPPGPAPPGGWEPAKQPPGAQRPALPPGQHTPPGVPGPLPTPVSDCAPAEGWG